MAHRRRIKKLERGSGRTLDLRLVIGVVLVATSVSGVVALVAALDRSVAVYVTGEAIASGEPLSTASLRIIQVRLGDSLPQYLRPGDAVDGQFTRRSFGAGELIAKSTIASASAPDQVTTVISVSDALPAAVHQGSQVEVWAVPDGTLRAEQIVEPSTVLDTAEVVRITHADGFAAAGTSTVELRIPRSALQSVLAAQAIGMRFTIVAVGAP